MFGVIWPSARALASRLTTHELRGRRVLELGCGLALPSLVAAKAGAEVTATDQHPDTERFLAENLERNRLQVRYARLDWSGAAPPEVPERGFDLVLASDVLYAAPMPDGLHYAIGLGAEAEPRSITELAPLALGALGVAPLVRAA